MLVQRHLEGRAHAKQFPIVGVHPRYLTEFRYLYQRFSVDITDFRYYVRR